MTPKLSDRILLVCDPGKPGDAIADQLTEIGYSLERATSDRALESLADSLPNLIVVGAPTASRDSTALIKSLSARTTAPIVAIGGPEAAGLCVKLLDAGADDFAPAAIGADELKARIRAAIRRAALEPYRPDEAEGAPMHSHGILRAGGISLDLTTCRVTVNGVVKTLTPNEFRLMAVFLRAPEQVFTREDLRARVWPDDRHSLHLVEVHIANLRAKIEADPHRPTFVLTVRAMGYKFVPPQ